MTLLSNKNGKLQLWAVKSEGFLLKAVNIINRYIMLRKIGCFAMYWHILSIGFEQFIRSRTFWSRIIRSQV